jgi:hypothetical protein
MTVEMCGLILRLLTNPSLIIASNKAASQKLSLALIEHGLKSNFWRWYNYWGQVRSI